MTKYIVKRTYTKLYGELSDRVEYVSYPLDIVGCEISDTDILKSYKFSYDNDMYNQIYKSGTCNGTDRTGGYIYKQEIIPIEVEEEIILPRVIRSGEVSIGELKLKCHVLDNGKSIIEEESLEKFMDWMSKGIITASDAEKFAKDFKSL
jgi:hypothetical protein